LVDIMMRNVKRKMEFSSAFQDVTRG